MEFDYVNYIFFPLLIFLIRISDVSLGTVRIVCVSRDLRFLSAILGFFEVLIWLYAISQIMRNLNNPIQYVAYAAGFGMGNYVGISIERKLSMGNRAVRILTKVDAKILVKTLREHGFGVTSIDGDGMDGPVQLIFTIVRRNRVAEVVAHIKQFNPKAFYTIEDIKDVHDSNGSIGNRQSGFKDKLFAQVSKMK